MRSLFSISLIFFALTCFSQDLPPSTQQQLENIAEANEEDPQDDNLLQQLDYFRKHPINLNTATAEELQALKVLTDLQIANFIQYRSLLGSFINIYELQAVPTWDVLTIKKIIPFVIIGNTISVKENFLSRFRNGDQSILFRLTRVLEKSKGYNSTLTTHYLGDRNHLMFRYRYQYKDLLYFGVTGDKDAGEQFFKGAQSKGFDFYSFHFFARRLGIIKSIALGDYTVNLGQGLIQWQSLGLGKSSEVMSIKRQAPVLVPYRSAGEFYFNRGFGVTVQKKNIEATVFASYKKISGNIIRDTMERFSSLLTSGYYRTPSEIANRNQVNLTSFGVNISYSNSFFKLGWNAVGHQLDIPLQKRDEPYNLYAINGRKVFNSSVDYSYTYKNVHFFGETAVDRNFHKAFVNGALLSVDPKADLSFLYRNIQKEYQSLFGNAFTENTMPVNEKGFYAGVAVRPMAGWELNAYADFFHFPWIKYLVNAPSRGYDYLVQLNYQPNKQFGIYVRFRNKNKPRDSSGNGIIYYPQNQLKQNLRIHMVQQLLPVFSLTGRVELVWLNHQLRKNSQGFLGYIEGKYSWRKFAGNLRFQYFETNDYDSRIYVYESDVLYNFSIPAFYDKGFRYYINCHYELFKKFEVWLRCAQTLYPERSKIGSSLDEINKNRKTELKIQLRYLL
ncbi:MAG: helix-hairpin-helix domain-containing protein [Flavisolibacter sp.]|nr:helix-hairpin-helix domain-containing protein [Flavisolibacter sp.]